MQMVSEQGGRHRAQVAELQDAIAAYTELALASIPPTKRASATVAQVAPRMQRGVAGKQHCPVLSLPVEVRPDGKYEGLPYVKRVLPGIRFVGGINVPKLIEVEDNFGQVRGCCC